MNLLNQRPLLCLITDRQTTRANNGAGSLDKFAALIDLCSRAAQAGIHLIQIREKDLPARELCELVSAVVRETSGTGAAVLVNDRVDVALACGARGVHLRADSLPADATRRLVGDNFIVGASTHSIAEAQSASEMGASFVLLGPIFDTPSKRAYGSPLGLDLLAEAVRTATCPVLALGGINSANAGSLFERGAAGLAAIRLFAEAEDLSELIDAIREQYKEAGSGAHNRRL